jgi:hypothetical protein
MATTTLAADIEVARGAVEALCREIEDRRRVYFQREVDKKGNYVKRNPTASDVGECAREITYQMLYAKPTIEWDLQARFDRGNLIEDLILRDLLTLGFSPRVERTPFELKDPRGRLVCRGKVDGFLDWEVAGQAKPLTFPFECKSLNPNVYSRIHTVEDFARYDFAAKYPRQLGLYCYGYGHPAGFFILDDCLGHWKLIPVPLDIEALDKIMKRLEAAVEARAQIGEKPLDQIDHLLPGYHEDPVVCRRCWAYGRYCTPPLEFHGLALMTDPDFEATLDRRGELERFADEFDALDKEVKERVKGKDGLVVGNWLINGKTITRKEYTVKASAYWQAKITRIEERPNGGQP